MAQGKGGGQETRGRGIKEMRLGAKGKPRYFADSTDSRIVLRKVYFVGT
jgi:hypothetical protein